MIGADGPGRPPARRRGADRVVAQNVDLALAGQAGGNDTACVRGGLGRCRRIDGDDDARISRGRGEAQPVEQRARPQRILALGEDLGVEFLPAEPRAAIARLHRRQEVAGQVGRIVVRAHAHGHRARIGHDIGEQFQRPGRRGRRKARPAAQSQAELQHVPALARIWPFHRFVAPGGGELRPAQAAGIVRRKRMRDGSVRPDQPPPRRLVDRPVVARARHNARRPLDHHLADVGQRFADQRDRADDAPGERPHGARQPVHPFGAGARLARTAPAQQKPGRPAPAPRRLLRLTHRQRAAVKRHTPDKPGRFVGPPSRPRAHWQAGRSARPPP